MKEENKNHWYDGKFYDKLIAPNLDVTFVQIMRMIEPGSKVIDIGCGTGRFVFKIAGRAKQAVGVDLSIRNINLANQLKKKRNIANIEFIHANAFRLSKLPDQKYDYATISYVLHEINISRRTELLNELKKIAEHIIIADYLIPQPKNKRGLLNYAAEFFAGPDHFKNFISFKKNNGLMRIIRDTKLTIIEEHLDITKTSSIIKLR